MQPEVGELARLEYVPLAVPEGYLEEKTYGRISGTRRVRLTDG
jgi:hypothetical protein